MFRTVTAQLCALFAQCLAVFSAGNQLASGASMNGVFALQNTSRPQHASLSHSARPRHRSRFFIYLFFFHLAQTILKTAANPRRHYLEICLVSQKLKAVP